MFKKTEEVKEVKKEKVKEEVPNEVVYTYEQITYAIVNKDNNWHLVKIEFSLTHDNIKKTTIRTESVKAIIVEEFKICVAKDIL